MSVHTGARWSHGAAEEWHVRVEDGRVVDEGPGLRPGGEPAVFLDGITNWHTHIGDAFLTGRAIPHDLDAAVRPRTGLKHQELAKSSRPTLVDAMTRALVEYASQGIQTLVDFREQGPDGVMQAREAGRRAGPGAPRSLLLGRPSEVPCSEAELVALLHLADGVGLPGLTDWGAEACRRLADAAHLEGKLVALHVAEARPEAMEKVLELRPHILVHLCHTTQRELAQAREAGAFAVLCPSSNQHFGQKTPLERVMRAELDWGVGTDNAMLGGRDITAEARLLKAWHPDTPDGTLLAALTRSPAKVLNRGPLEIRPTQSRTLLILPTTASGEVQWKAEARVLAR